MCSQIPFPLPPGHPGGRRAPAFLELAGPRDLVLANGMWVGERVNSTTLGATRRVEDGGHDPARSMGRGTEKNTPFSSSPNGTVA